MKIQVECYSGYKGDERPVKFLLGERAFYVLEIQDQWYGPESTYFKVQADDGNFYILRIGASGLRRGFSKPIANVHLERPVPQNGNVRA